uniref:Copia-like polyprotein n=1 Tax=Arachis hypogaea TaxID=3818 RepID=G0Y6T7_ARAHY|nr:copia-like polyprotein [Arachis hypogaea]
MGPQRKLGIYVRYDSPYIVRYLEIQTGYVFKAWFTDCHFDESKFPTLGGENKLPEKELNWNASSLMHLDPRSRIANELPDAFSDIKRITKSYIPAENAPIRIDVPVGQVATEANSCQKRGRAENAPIRIDVPVGQIATETNTRQKRGRPVSSKDKNPRKRKEVYTIPVEKDIVKTPAVVQNSDIILTPEHVQKWDRNKTIVNEIFAYNVALNIMQENKDLEPRLVEECRQKNDWPKWKEVMKAELDSLAKREVFGPVVRTPEDVKPVGYQWVFVRKRNKKNEVVRYKARLMAQGFSQRPGIDYEETYSPVMDAITLSYLVSLSAYHKRHMHLMDVVTAYLYGSLDRDIYMKVPEELKISKPSSEYSQGLYSVKLQRSLYGLKQSGRMWYNRLTEYLAKNGFKNDDICPCVFIKKTTSGFIIIAVYVDDLNIIGTPEEIPTIIKTLKEEFEMKDLGRTKFCFDLQIEHTKNGIFIHQATYTEKILKRFYMDKSHPLSTPMIVRSLDMENDQFRPKEENEDILGPEVLYLSAIRALMYLANNTRPDISFAVNLLARYTISWRSTKQMIAATSSNHAEILAIHEASRECFWLRSLIQYILSSCGLIDHKIAPTVLFEDNTACIAQLKGGYIKSDRTKHISLKFFFTYDFQNQGTIDIQQIRSSDNLANLFTKSLPKSSFEKLVHQIGMHQFRDIK